MVAPSRIPVVTYVNVAANKRHCAFMPSVLSGRRASAIRNWLSPQGLRSFTPARRKKKWGQKRPKAATLGAAAGHVNRVGVAVLGDRLWREASEATAGEGRARAVQVVHARL